VRRDTQFWSALLKLYGIATGDRGSVNQFLGYLDIAVVIDAYLRNDETWFAITDQVVSDFYLVTHQSVVSC
jgi:hypothetical protein